MNLLFHQSTLLKKSVLHDISEKNINYSSENWLYSRDAAGFPQSKKLLFQTPVAHKYSTLIKILFIPV